jgi:uncharacterized protein YndB with AHSA1/START domain
LEASLGSAAALSGGAVDRTISGGRWPGRVKSQREETDVLPHSPDVIWQALTTGELIARWLMPNDFQPALGRRFAFQTRPMGTWDGVVHCQILEITPQAKLVYSWKGGAEGNDAYGSRLDSIVTWTLTAVEGGTRLRLVHSGFRSPGNGFAFDVMSGGWAKVMRRIDSVAAGLEASD